MRKNIFLPPVTKTRLKNPVFRVANITIQFTSFFIIRHVVVDMVHLSYALKGKTERDKRAQR